MPVVVVDDPCAALGPVAARLQGHPASYLTMLGITGTNGKTYTAYLLEAALARLGGRPGLLSSLETVVGDRRRRSAVTTPAAPRLQELLAQMRDAGSDSCVMEVSSHALDQHGWTASTPAWSPSPTSPASTWTNRGTWDPTSPPRRVSSARVHVPGGGGGPRRRRPPLPREHKRTDTAVAVLMLLELGVPPIEATAALEGPVSIPGRMEHVRAVAARRFAGLPVPAVVELPTRQEAIRFALEAAGPDGTVVLNGGGCLYRSRQAARTTGDEV